VPASPPPDIYDNDDEFDEAIELSAERASEIARGLTEVAQEYPNIACPARLVLTRIPEGMLLESDLVRWVIRPDQTEHRALLGALIRPELLCAWIAGNC
jgi:hypothetical protein